MPEDVCIVTVLVDLPFEEAECLANRYLPPIACMWKWRSNGQKLPQLVISAPLLGYLLSSRIARRIVEQLPQEKILEIFFIREVTQEEMRSGAIAQNVYGRREVIVGSLGRSKLTPRDTEWGHLYTGRGMPLPFGRRNEEVDVIEVRAPSLSMIDQLIQKWRDGGILSEDP
ncbi:MAG TPA: hypothetical protein VGE59_00645 [Patescibacteria group bacterium]